jgi:hypothetical protein
MKRRVKYGKWLLIHCHWELIGITKNNLLVLLGVFGLFIAAVSGSKDSIAILVGNLQEHFNK